MNKKIDCDSAVPKNSYFGIGMEKLDRDAYDPTEVYDLVADIGVKWVRIQSGWAKDEKTAGSPLYFIRKVASKKIGKVWHDNRLNDLVTISAKKGDAVAFIYYLSTDLIKNKRTNLKMDIRFSDARVPQLVDLLTGDISEPKYDRDGEWIKITLPVMDYPLAITFGDFVKTKA